MKAKEKEDLVAALREHLRLDVKHFKYHDASGAMTDVRIEVEIWWKDPFADDVLLDSVVSY